ncbi:MAG: dynamin family protein [Ardenticatenaceae bacterium]|nr:dynamin family protein [Ardenticatenaceae bacterium]MCB8990529.1 dynamin family protein [Ardenticatenaceae bacterium]MCB9005665.1 dynamin family protein [Ardenticatenaceae bacterium]
MENILNSDQEELLKRTRDVLGQLRDILADTTAPPEDRTALAESIRQLDELFLLVLAGEFNSGKSSFINALVGQPLLVEGVTPTTSQIYLLKYGDKAEQKPVEKGVWEQTAPVDILKEIVIVDTPGTNAILREHEALTAEFIPRSDLVLFITSADRPFTESERNFLTQIRDWGKKIILVVNKVDILASDAEKEQVIAFVTNSARNLVGDVQAVYAVSSKLAKEAKAGNPRVWPSSGFEPLEQYIYETLDDDGRFRLKLLNPLGVGHKLVRKQLDQVENDLAFLQEDRQLLDDIAGQMTYYSDDMQRNFKARLSELNSILFEMEKRGNEFFDDMIRIARIPDLVRAKNVERAFEEEVVGDTPQQLERRVSELIDWMVEQDLRQWTAVADHLAQRRDDQRNRIVGEGGPREGTLAYDRQRLIDSIGAATRRAIETYDKDREAEEMAESARTAVVNTGLAGVGVTLGVAIAVAAHVVWLDVTGVLAGVAAAALGFLILPARRRKAKQELSEKLADLRGKLVSSLTEQFDREMRRGTQRIEDTVAPFGRFVRAEYDKIDQQRNHLDELEAHVIGLQAQLKRDA